MARYQLNKTILDFLKKHPNYSYNAPTVKHELEHQLKEPVNINTVRSELRRLHLQKKIVRESHGYYRINLDAESLYYLENPPTLLHGIMISMMRVRKVQNLGK